MLYYFIIKFDLQHAYWLRRCHFNFFINLFRMCCVMMLSCAFLAFNYWMLFSEVPHLNLLMAIVGAGTWESSLLLALLYERSSELKVGALTASFWCWSIILRLSSQAWSSWLRLWLRCKHDSSRLVEICSLVTIWLPLLVRFGLEGEVLFLSFIFDFVRVTILPYLVPI